MADYADTVRSFLRTLHRQGVCVPVGTSAQVLSAIAAVGPLDRGRVRAATRALTCTSPAEVAVHDRVFAQFFGRAGIQGNTGAVEILRPGAAGGADDADGSAAPHGRASAAEVLRHADLEHSEHASDALRLLDHLRLCPPLRRSALKRGAARGELDLARVLYRSMRTGELAELPRRARVHKKRQVTVVLDVSNSMWVWLPALLKFGRAAVDSAGARCFAAGTRLTPLTGPLSRSRLGLGLPELVRLAPDAAGGTKLGDALLELLAEHVHAVRSSVVVIVSDGWESGDGRELEQALGRMARLAHTLIWVNPRAGRPGFAAHVLGLQIAQTTVDHMVPATTVAQWEAVADLIAQQRMRERQVRR